MSRFLDALNSGKVLLMDGAMGTELMRRGLEPKKEKAANWNLSHPNDVREVHQAYLDAGAACLLTNTFSLVLAGRELNDACRIGVNLAANAGNRAHFVFLDSGPEPPALASAYFMAIGDPIGCDVLFLETFTRLHLLQLFVKRHAPVLPCIVSFAFGRWSGELRSSRKGLEPETVARFVNDHRDHFVALGVNCGRDIGMDEIIDIVRRYRKVTDLPILARPNAGTPKRVGGEWLYPETPARMAARLPELIDAGATLIGGCCGTTPEHIATFRKVIDRLGVGWTP